MTDDPIWGGWSAETLTRIADEESLVINAVIYAEVSIGLESNEALEAALPSDLYRHEHLPYEAAFLAGRTFLRYWQAGGIRRSPPPDFYIGAHAAVAGYRS